MTPINIFKTNHSDLSNIQLLDCLTQLKANECDVLYVHSGLNFGTPNMDISKPKLLQIIIDVLLELNVKTLIFPTFTFSFNNGKDFSIMDSKTSMGILNEYFRKIPSVRRSKDPLMSHALLGENQFLIDDIGRFSCGKDSTYDLLRKSKLKVKFLFLGPKIGDCFTYMHYLEHLFEVPYRYEKEFTGNIIEQNQIESAIYSLFVRYGNVNAGAGSYIYENILIERGVAKRVKFGNSNITILSEFEATTVYKELLELSPNFFLTDVFEESKKTPHIPVDNMTAL